MAEMSGRSLRGAQGGSEAALAELFRLHWPDVRTGRRTSSSTTPRLPEDIAQEAFLAAIRNLDRFDRRRPFAPWLHRIVVNRAIDHARARVRCGRRDRTCSRRSRPPPSSTRPRRRRRCFPRSAACRRISAPWSSSATCSSHTPGEIATNDECSAGHRQLPAAARPRCDAGRAVSNALDRVRLPDADATEERARRVVLAAFETHARARNAAAARPCRGDHGRTRHGGDWPSQLQARRAWPSSIASARLRRRRALLRRRSSRFPRRAGCLSPPTQASGSSRQTGAGTAPRRLPRGELVALRTLPRCAP